MFSVCDTLYWQKRASQASRAIPLTSRSNISNVRSGYVQSHGSAHHETAAYGMRAPQFIPTISARVVSGNMGRFTDVMHDEYYSGRTMDCSGSAHPVTPIPVVKRKHHELGVPDSFVDVDSTDEEGDPAVTVTKEEEVTDEGLIPSHLIDVVAQRLLSKRPRPLVNASHDRHFMEGLSAREACLQSSRYSSRYSSWTSHGAGGRGPKADYHTQSYGHRTSPDLSFSTPPMPSYCHNSDKPSALPAWLLMEAEAAAVAAAAADRRVARYLGLLGAAVGAEAVGGRPSTDQSDSYDISYNAAQGEPWPALEYNNHSRNSLRRESWTSADTGLRLGSTRPQGLYLQSPCEDSPVLGRRHGAHDKMCVYEISSEGGSCQPSPEGPVLSLCCDLGEDHGYRAGAGDALTPLDLGDPAIDPAAARPAARTMVSAPLVAEDNDVYADSGLDLVCRSSQPYLLASAADPSLECSAASGEMSSSNEISIPRKEAIIVSEAAIPADDGVLCGLGAGYCEGSDFSTCIITGSNGGSGSGECDTWIAGCGRSAVPIVDNAAVGGSPIGDFDGGTWDALYNRDDDCSGWW
jgi:hypothetical protein